MHHECCTLIVVTCNKQEEDSLGRTDERRKCPVNVVFLDKHILLHLQMPAREAVDVDICHE